MTKNNRGETVNEVLLTILVIVLLFGGIIAGQSTTEKRWQKAAVEHGAAHWIISADGSTAFKWNNEAEAAQK